MTVLELKVYSHRNRHIVKAINTLGVESLCGVSHIESDEVGDFLSMMEQDELAEILIELRKTPFKYE